MNASPAWKNQYGNLVTELDAAYREFEAYGYARDYYNEIISRIELFTIAARLNLLVNAESGYKQRLTETKDFLSSFYKEYNSKVDQRLFETLMGKYVSGQDKKYISPLLLDLLTKSGNDFSKLASKLYSETDWDDGALTPEKLDVPVNDVVSSIRASMVYNLYTDIVKTYQLNVQPKLTEIQNLINQLQRKYSQAQREVFKEKKFYPDANSTMRVSYGKVKRIRNSLSSFRMNKFHLADKVGGTGIFVNDKQHIPDIYHNVPTD